MAFRFLPKYSTLSRCKISSPSDCTRRARHRSASPIVFGRGNTTSIAHPALYQRSCSYDAISSTFSATLANSSAAAIAKTATKIASRGRELFNRFRRIEPSLECHHVPTRKASVNSSIGSEVEDIKKDPLKFEPKFESKFEPKCETKYDKFESKFEPKFESKFEPKFESKFESKLDQKYEPKFETSSSKAARRKTEGVRYQLEAARPHRAENTTYDLFSDLSKKRDEYTHLQPNNIRPFGSSDGLFFPTVSSVTKGQSSAFNKIKLLTDGPSSREVRRKYSSTPLPSSSVLKDPSIHSPERLYYRKPASPKVSDYRSQNDIILTPRSITKTSAHHSSRRSKKSTQNLPGERKLRKIDAFGMERELDPLENFPNQPVRKLASGPPTSAYSIKMPDKESGYPHSLLKKRMQAEPLRQTTRGFASYRRNSVLQTCQDLNDINSVLSPADILPVSPVCHVSVPFYFHKRTMATEEEKQLRWRQKQCEDLRDLCKKRSSIKKDIRAKKTLPKMCPKECPCLQDVVMKRGPPIPPPRRLFKPEDEPKVCPVFCTIPRTDDELKIQRKTLPKIPESVCPCVEKARPIDCPPIKRLPPFKKEDPPHCPPCTVEPCCPPRTDETLIIERKTLPPVDVPLKLCPCLHVPPVCDSVVLKRLPRREVPDTPCVTYQPCPQPRADDDLKIERKTLPKLEMKPCPCVEKSRMIDVPEITPLDMKLPDQCKDECIDPCSEIPRSDEDDWDYPNCECDVLLKGAENEPWCGQRKKRMKMMGKRSFSTKITMNDEEDYSSDSLFYSCASDESLTNMGHNKEDIKLEQKEQKRNSTGFHYPFLFNRIVCSEFLRAEPHTLFGQSKRHFSYLKNNYKVVGYIRSKTQLSTTKSLEKSRVAAQTRTECDNTKCVTEMDPMQAITCDLPERPGEKSFWQKVMEYFRARSDCPGAEEYEKRGLIRKAEMAAQQAGLRLYDPKVYYAAKKGDQIRVPPCKKSKKKKCPSSALPSFCTPKCNFGPPPCSTCTKVPTNRCIQPRKPKKKKGSKSAGCPSCKSYGTCTLFGSDQVNIQRRGCANWRNPYKFYDLDEIDNYLYELQKMSNSKKDKILYCMKIVDKRDYINMDALYSKLFRKLEVLNNNHLLRKRNFHNSISSEYDTLSNASSLGLNISECGDEYRRDSILSALENLYVIFQELSQGKHGTEEQIEAAESAMKEIDELLANNLSKTCQ